jgi:hypothetical protein
MVSGAGTQTLVKDVFDGRATVIHLPDPELITTAAGQLPAEGWKESEAMATCLGNLLTSLCERCTNSLRFCSANTNAATYANPANA